MIFVSGFGSSCSQPLFANRPSHTVGSGRKMISRPPWLPSLDEAWDDPEALEGSGLGCIGTAVGAAGRGAGEAGVALGGGAGGFRCASVFPGVAAAAPAAAGGGVTGLGAGTNGVAGPPSAIAVPAMNPSCTDRRQKVSASLYGWPFASRMVHPPPPPNARVQ